MISSVVPEGSEDEQICEIHVKSMYIVVEKKVSAMLQELLRQVGTERGMNTRVNCI